MENATVVSRSVYHPFPTGFCPDAFWDTEVSWNTAVPDLTLCFQLTVVSWIPSFFLFLCIPVQVFRMLYSKHRIAAWTWVSLTKLCFTVVLILLNLVDLAYIVYQSSTGSSAIVDAEFISLSLKVVALAITIAFIYTDKTHAKPSSGSLFIYWILLLIQESIALSSRIKRAGGQGITEDFRFILDLLAFPIIVVEFGLSCVAERFPVLNDGMPNPSPEPMASVPSKLFWEWFRPMAYRGWKMPLQQEDLWNLIRDDQAKHLVERFQKHWDRELTKRERSLRSRKPKPYSPSVFKALFWTCWKTQLVAFGLKLSADILVFVGPQLLRLVITFVEDPTIQSWKGYLFAGLMFLSAAGKAMITNHHSFVSARLGMRIRNAVMAAVYRKALKLSSSAKKSSNLGEMVNLMSVDAQRLDQFMTYVGLLWSAPFLIVVSIYFLYDLLGASIFAGLAVIVLFAPMNAVLATLNKRIQAALMNHKDSRIKTITEVLGAMKMLKLYAWEESFEKKIQNIREMELKELRRGGNLNSLSATNWFLFPFLIGLTTFATYVLSSPDNVLDAQKAFVALSLLTIIRNPITLIHYAITVLIQATISIRRLTKFLCSEEFDPDNVEEGPSNGPAVKITDGTFTWAKDERPVLRDINLSIAKGKLVAVVGQVGCGKSSLISAMLGQMHKLEGRVAVSGRVAYVSQQAWIQNLTVRDNILFGTDLDEVRYDNVLEACALKPDLNIFPAGDLTEIGEKGINLSGGQKQRVSLARAVYADSDVYLLDDTLSVVDAHVGRHIFKHVIGPDGLLQEKTRILVTHGIKHLPVVDLIVVLDNGVISEVGNYEQLLQQNGAFSKFLRTFANEHETKDAEDGKRMQHDVVDLARARSSSSISVAASVSSQAKIQEVFGKASLRSSRRNTKATAMPEGDEEKQKKKDGQLIADEYSVYGRVKWEVYNTYLRSATYKAAFGMAGSFVIFSIFNVSGNFWLTAWTKDSDIPERRNDTYWRDLRLGIYGLFGVLQALSTMVCYWMMAYGQASAARNLHRNLLHRVMRAPQAFFDTTPLGRIVNRFSRDIENVDTMIPMHIESLVFCFFSILFTFIVISITTPVFIAVIIPLGVFYLLVQQFFVATSRQLKRFDAVSRSPIHSHFQESVNGSSVIMAYRQSERFIEENERRIDTNAKACFLNKVSERWVAVRLDCAGTLVTFFAALFAVVARDNDWGIAPADVGLSITYSLSVTDLMNWMVRAVSDLETNIIAVERVKEYSEIEMEAPWENNSKPDPSWPAAGRITFDNYQTRYRKGLDLVLRGIDCHIESGEKIGIVGRTGAGKSSLTLALFRLIEPAGGAIFIDDINTAKLGLHDVRSRITILPQDPVLFSGSLRMNLDPFDKYSDEEIWNALDHSHLKAFVSTLPDGLDHHVAEGGENLSVGQRQLICLARALLRKTKILVLDEATAAIDLETDALIQETIRREFADCTILTIAHRINTIMDSSKVMVLDQGRVKEFASPEELLSNPDSMFYSLAKSAGAIELAKL